MYNYNMFERNGYKADKPAHTPIVFAPKNNTTEENSDSGLFSDIGSMAGNISGLFGNSTPSGGGAGWLGVAQGATRGLGTLFGSGDIDKSGQSFFNIDSGDSDVKQSLNGALNGASMGAAFGPIGAAVGGVLGLGASFLDDI